MDEEDVMSTLVDAMLANDDIMDLINGLNAGYGTYDDVDGIAEFIGDKIAVELGARYSGDRLHEYLKAGHKLVVEAGEQAQTNLNNAAKIGIKPMTTHCPENRIADLIKRLANVDNELLLAELIEEVPSMMMSMVDDMVEYNADFQARSGLTPVIVRTWSGSYPSHDTKHTDWCHDLAGTYEYGNEPKNVYARHKGCRCKVEYFPSKGAQGRITALAKGQVDVDSVLWNTKPETLEKRIRKMERREANIK